MRHWFSPWVGTDAELKALKKAYFDVSGLFEALHFWC